MRNRNKVWITLAVWAWCMGAFLLVDSSGQAVVSGNQVTRNTTAQRLARTPQKGELVLDTTLGTMYTGNSATVGGVAFNIAGNSASITGNVPQAQVTNLVADLALKSPLASPTFTGIVTSPALSVTGNIGNTLQYGGMRIIDAAIAANGVSIINGSSANQMLAVASGVANTILGGGTTANPNIIGTNAGSFNTCGGPYDCIIDSLSVGANTCMVPHGRIFGTCSHVGMVGGSLNSAYNVDYGGIYSGTGCFIEGSNSVVFGGSGNRTTSNAISAAILAGVSNTVEGARATILGGTNGFTANNESLVGPGGNVIYSGGVALGQSSVLGDGRTVADAAITTGTTTLTSATAAFVAGDVGKTVVLVGAGARGANQGSGPATTAGTLRTTIASRTNATTVELTAAASTTVNGARLYILTTSGFGVNAAILGGLSNTLGVTATSQYSTIPGGRSIDIETDYSIGLGGQTNSTTLPSTPQAASHQMVGGKGVVGVHYGGFSHGSGNFSVVGDNQWIMIHPWRQVINSTVAAELRLDGSGVRPSIADNTAWTFSGEVIAKVTGTTTVNSYHFEGLIVRGSGVATTTVKWSTVDTTYEDVTTGNITISADTTNGALSIQWRDTAGGAVTWDVGSTVFIHKVAA